MKHIKMFNEEFTNKYKCPICGSPMYRTDAGGYNATLQCSSDEAKFWNFPRGSKEQNDAHDHFEKSITYVSNKDWSDISESKSNKKKRTKIKKVSDATYNWTPTTNTVSPAPIPNTTISQIKI